MAIYRVYAENDAGTAGEQPPIEADSPEEAVAIYMDLQTQFKVVDVRLEEDIPEA